MSGPRYEWRDAQPDDLTGLAALDDACFQADGHELLAWGVYPELLVAPDASLACALASDGQIVAVSWAKLGSSPAMLGGKVHPLHRRTGLGVQALRQAEARAAGGPVFIRNEAFTDGAAALYEREGYTADFVEFWMTRSPRDPLPAMPPEVTLIPWSDDNAGQFYETYIDSFKDRGGPRPSAQEWIAGYAADEDFRPDLCLLAYADGQPAAFVTAGPMHPPRFDQPIGWISQVGVRPAWRGRGIIDGLIGEIGRHCAAEGLLTLGLDVNVDNPRAIRAYEHNGFTVVGRRAKFSKTLPAD